MNPLLRTEINQGRLGHAYLLYGQQGRAEAEALAFAMALNCLAPVDGEACGHCRHCLAARDGIFPDLVVMEPEGVYYKVNQIRELRRYFALSAKSGLYRVFLLQKADMMREECADMMLKALEEPVENTVFLLTAENDDRILETIASRCRSIRLGEAAAIVAGEGAEELFALFCRIKEEPLAYLFDAAEKYGKDRETLTAFFETAAALFGENELYRRGGPAPVFAFPATRWSEAQLFDLWQWALYGPVLLESNINLKLIAECFLLCIKRKEITNGNCSWYTL